MHIIYKSHFLFHLKIGALPLYRSSSDNGADSIPSNIAPRVNKQMCIEKTMQQTMNSNFS